MGPGARRPRPGAGQRRRLDRRLPARHHPGGPDRPQPPLRALPPCRPPGDAGHRHRLLHRPPRAGDPARLREVRGGADRDGRQRGHLPAPSRGARGGQGDGLPRADHRPAGQVRRRLAGGGRGGRPGGGRPAAARRQRSPALAAVPGDPARHRGRPPAPLHPRRRDAGHRRAARRRGPGGARHHGGPGGGPVRQGRRRGPRPHQDGPARAAHPLRGRRVPGPDRAQPWHPPRPRRPPARRSARLRHDLRGRHHRPLPDRVHALSSRRFTSPSHGNSTIWWSRSRSSAPGPSRATPCIPTCAAARDWSRSPTSTPA